MQPFLTGLTIIFFLLTFWMLAGSRIKETLNLVDKRIFLQGEESYQKLNRLLVDGDISVYNLSMFSERHISLTVSFKEGKTTTEAKFRGDSFDKVINSAYEWAQNQGLLKE